MEEQQGGTAHTGDTAARDGAAGRIEFTGEPEFTELGTLDPQRVSQIRAIAAAAEAADGVAPLGEQPLLALDRPQPGIAHVLVEVEVENEVEVAAAPAKALAAYAQAADSDEGHDVEFVVAVPFRGRGLGGRLAEWLVRRHPHMSFWAHGDGPAAKAIAGALGMGVVRELLVMEREREGAPSIAEAAGREDPEIEILDLRTAYERFGADAVDAAILRVNNAAFSWHPEQGGWTLETLRERMDVSWFDPAGFFLAVEKGEPLVVSGFHWTKTVDGDDNNTAGPGGKPLGEVYVVGVDPSAQGRGLGQWLTAVGIAHLEAEGIDTVELYVEGDNEKAIHAYERLGFAVAKRDVMYGPVGA